MFPICFNRFSVLLHLTKIGITTGSKKHETTKAHQGTFSLLECLLCLQAKSKELEGDSRKQAATVGELDKAT